MRAAVGLVLLMLAAATPPALGAELRATGQFRSAGPVTTEASKKIGASLRALIADAQSLGITAETAAALGAASRFSSETLQVDDSARVQVYVFAADTTEHTLEILRRHGLDIEIVNREFGIIQGWIPMENLEALAAEDVVLKIRPPSYGTHDTGSVTSEGDAVHRCEGARALGFTGTGVKVGVISDGVSGLAASQASGDLPGVEVLSAGSGDEGTALLEIVHDCAPGAALAFSTGGTTSLSFILAVDALIDDGAHIVVDDLSFFDERYFEDGPMALHDRAVGNNVLRVASAGNAALAHYQGMFTPGIFDPEVPGTRHDFGGGDSLLRLRVPGSPGGTTAAIFLQWANPFGAAGDDFDVCVRKTDGSVLACSVDVQDGDGDPVETVPLPPCVGPSASSCDLDIQVTLFSGTPRLIEMYCRRCAFEQFNIPADSIFGHKAAPEVLAVAAVAANSPLQIEPYSARGPATIQFPAPEVRVKPDLTGLDGVATSRPGFNPFFGTSAAAPHVAGVAALVAQANPSYLLLAPAEVNDVNASLRFAFRRALQATALDLGVMGFDTTFGSGRADALAAVQAELTKARCEVLTDRTIVPLGQQFTITVNTFPGTGDPWDIYVVGVVDGTTVYSLDFATQTIGAPNVIQPARPTAPITLSTQRFTFTAPLVAQVQALCILAAPDVTRISRFSSVSIVFTP